MVGRQGSNPGPADKELARALSSPIAWSKPISRIRSRKAWCNGAISDLNSSNGALNHADEVWISWRPRRRLKSMTFLRTSVRTEPSERTKPTFILKTRLSGISRSRIYS